MANSVATMSVAQCADFIGRLKGCSQVAAAITAEEYDGAALLLAAETPGALEALGAKPLEQVRIKRAIAGAVYGVSSHIGF
eukprot:COSAG01_NODE_26706_length_705_cov_1.679868_1_plen_81_part_00